MQLKIIALGTRMPAWVEAGFAEFQKRLQPHAKLSLVELDIPKRGKNYSAEQLKNKEAALIVAQLTSDDIIVTLDERGKQPTSPEFAAHLQTWKDNSRNVSFIIGGPDGLADSIKTQADWQWSLSKLVFPHALVRIIIAEQLYRGFSILNNHPYHRI